MDNASNTRELLYQRFYQIENGLMKANDTEVSAMKRGGSLLLGGGLLILLAACGPQEHEVESGQVPESCVVASEHMQRCFPEREAQIPASCTEESAQAILAGSCEQLQAEAASDSKADSGCSPWFWWLCTGGGSGAAPTEATGYTFRLDISVCESPLCTINLFGTDRSGAECGRITLEDERGEVVATDYLNDYLASGGVQETGPGFKNLDLPAGEYIAKLWRRDGQLARTTSDDPAEIEVSLLEGGEVETSARDFEILKTEAEAIRACSDVVGTLSSTCDGEPMDEEETEWGWVVRLDGLHDAGRYMDLKRASKYYMVDGHQFSFRHVRPGDYLITYIEMDIPSWSREINLDYEEYEELVERYATGNEIVERLEITLDDIAQQRVELVEKPLAHQECF